MSVNIMPASLGPDILLDPDLLLAVSSPAIWLLNDNMDLPSTNFRHNRKLGKGPVAGVQRESITESRSSASSVSSDEMTVIFCPP